MICISGGVPLQLPLIVEAKKRNILLTNDSEIFMQAVNCPVVGITGSSGKTTTTALVGEIAKLIESETKKVWVGGNIGIPLIEQIDMIQPEDLVVLELSSFQLELMGTSPQIATITNITPNHLDRHETIEAYTEAKARILAFQKDTDVAILNRDDQGAWNLRDKIKGKLFSFGKSKANLHGNGAFIEGETIVISNDGKSFPVCSTKDTYLLGEHNLLNLMAASSIAFALNISTDKIQNAIKTFQGVPHRLEFVKEINEVIWYNDSIATAPERTIAAIKSFNKPIVLLLGGKDKNLPWDRLSEIIHEKVDHVVIFGSAKEKIEIAVGPVEKNKRPYSVNTCKNMQDAIQIAHNVAEKGDVVLLSPGATSYDEFTDFEERGEKFRSWVQQLQ
jgi:UDP-N-acetylmuramoylalanine--D-glutamate ligase